MADILARKRQIAMTALRRHQRHYGGPCTFYLKQYLELGKLLAPATLAGRYGSFDELSLFAPALFLRPPHPIYQRLAESIRAHVRERLASELRTGHDLSDDLVGFDQLLGHYVRACEEVAAAIQKKRAPKPASATAVPAPARSA